MGVTCALHHVTHYDYDRAINLGQHTIRLRPAPHCKADIQSYALKIEPANHFINWQQDPFGNFLARVVFPEKTKSLRVEVDLVTEIKVYNPFDFFLESYAETIPFTYETHLKEELSPYLEVKENGALLQQFLSEVSTEETGTINWLVALNLKVHNALSYTIRMEPGVQTCDETLGLKSGSCRDMAWLLVQALRHLGYAARFASGYLIQLKADVKSLDGPSGTEVDFTDLHAWCEVYLPGAGWVGLDPTSGLFTGEGHIPLCCTPNPSSAAPISGTLEMCQSTLEHEMTVTRIHESRRVTKPYSDAEWRAIDRLGEKVDKALEKHEVRLTMGGEPTFVSLDDRTGNEWHFTALSPEKQKLGHDIFAKLSARFGRGAFLQHTQGKWYPGELLPRWAMNAYWRKDEKPLWLEPTLLADPNTEGTATVAAAETFLKRLSVALGIDEGAVIPAYEDAAYYLWKEQRIPIDDEINAADLYEATERKRLMERLEAGLGAATGYVLPLAYSAKLNDWVSNAWRFKSGKLQLLTGNSAVGLRLPLSQLPFVDQALVDEHIFPPRSGFDALEALPEQAQLLATKAKSKGQKKRILAENGVIKSALCVEVRDGHIHIFLPPIVYMEHFCDLLAAIEATAHALKVAVIIEGYGPPKDYRIDMMSVTPDPGVIEINIQPAASWAELKNIVTTVYDEARQARLVTDKFLIDGRRVGTGGGNHIVIGAQKPEDSPFLRRPDVLGSMIRFWQNHPSLSYLFAGMYIGPTSQAPRIDEARNDSLYELEIALKHLPDGPEAGEASPWLVDRLLRNLLVDLSGNTHRAEFCIDKLYSPDSDRGRLGLLELRGFEMSPHAQMNLVQSLLIRTLISIFWKKPYRGNLVRWGTQLHDRFMLSTPLHEDMQAVLDFIAQNGFRMDMAWFTPFFDFRFPTLGRTKIGSIGLELRHALEPWPVMGEENNGGGTSRAVDSSVERIEVKLTGAVPDHHILTCNGHAVPLSPSRYLNEQIGGVRFKAWAPYSALHPNLPVNSPLVFDIVDQGLGRSLGGCRYHVMHPGGRAYETLPLNENEAEGRMLSRFEAPTHTPGLIKVAPPEINREFPMTLDLRRFG